MEVNEFQQIDQRIQLINISFRWNVYRIYLIILLLYWNEASVNSFISQYSHRYCNETSIESLIPEEMSGMKKQHLNPTAWSYTCTLLLFIR